jgi:glycosyltransferase involved in cell wall biosynthesis
LYEKTKDGEPIGCSYIRLLRPFNHPSIASLISLSWGDDLPPAGKYDAVVVERLWRPDVTLSLIEDLVRKIRNRDVPLIYFIDDNLLDLNLDEPWYPFPSDEQRMVVRYLCRSSDGIVVGTETLKARLARFNNNITVLPNAIDEQLFSNSLSSNNEVLSGQSDSVMRVGYMGTHTHQKDLMSVLAPLRTFLRESKGRIALELVGVSADNRVLDCFQGPTVFAHTVGNSHSYERFVPWAIKHMKWSFAIAPLADNDFNSYKSDIKYLDYGALGIPAIYSDVAVYRNSVVHAETGWLCQNNCESWLAGLRRMRDDAQLRQSIARAASRYVMENRTLMHRAKEWISALEKLLNIRISQPKTG